MSNLEKANAALAANRAERERAANEVRATLKQRWAAVAEVFDAVPIEPRERQTLAGTTVQRTLGEVVRGTSPQLTGFFALSIGDAEAIAAALERFEFAAATGVEPR